MSRVSTETVSELTFDPMAPDVIADPYPHYDRLRSHDPVFPLQSGTWFITRYDDAALVLRDRRFGRDFTKGRAPETLGEPVHLVMSKMLVYLDPPDHTRIRAAVARAPQLREIEAMRTSIQRTVDMLIAQAEPRGHMDVVNDFALPLALTVVCELLGIPPSDRSMFFADGLRSNGRALDLAPIGRAELDRANARIKLLEEYFRDLFENRRRNPADDLTTHLVQAQETDETLSAQELLSTALFFFVAGHETTANLIGNALVGLFRHPSELDRIKRDPALVSKVVDELIRYDTSIQFSGRTAREDVELGGKLIKKDDVVMASLGAANRDPAVFADPHRLDLMRQNVRPLSFGGGIHFCLGAQLAHMEIAIGLSSLLKKFPTLKPIDLQNVKWKPSFVFRGVRSLPVAW